MDLSAITRMGAPALSEAFASEKPKVIDLVASLKLSPRDLISH